jgi:hypothetical protein
MSRSPLSTMPIVTKSKLSPTKDYPKVRKEDLLAADARFPQLESNITFWIADMMRFSTDKDARVRLEQQPDNTIDQRTPLFNSCYFSTQEAQHLSRLTVKVKKSQQTTLAEAFGAFLDERQRNNKGEVCTSSEIAPFLREMLRIPSDFQDHKEFKNEYKVYQEQWKKTRKQRRRK